MSAFFSFSGVLSMSLVVCELRCDRSTGTTKALRYSEVLHLILEEREVSVAASGLSFRKGFLTSQFSGI